MLIDSIELEQNTIDGRPDLSEKRLVFYSMESSITGCDRMEIAPLNHYTSIGEIHVRYVLGGDRVTARCYEPPYALEKALLWTFEQFAPLRETGKRKAFNDSGPTIE